MRCKCTASPGYLEKAARLKAVVVEARLIHDSRVAVMGPPYASFFSIAGNSGIFQTGNEVSYPDVCHSFGSNLVFESGNNNGEGVQGLILNACTKPKWLGADP